MIEWASVKRGVNKRLVRAVMRLYDVVQTKVRVGDGICGRFSVDVGIHQEYIKKNVLLPFLFAVAFGALCEDVRGGLLFKVLFANKLVLTADSMEELRIKFDKWKNAFRKKGFKANLGKTKAMVSG